VYLGCVFTQHRTDEQGQTIRDWEAATAGRSEPVEQELGYFVATVPGCNTSVSASRDCIGSGVIEAGCKTIVGSRCKQSGMFWSQTGAENILALRCIQASRRLDEF